MGCTRPATPAEDDALAAIKSTLDDMQAQEPERFAHDQSVRVINAVAATIYAYFVLSIRFRHRSAKVASGASSSTAV